jgi:hypothetical protein
MNATLGACWDILAFSKVMLITYAYNNLKELLVLPTQEEGSLMGG